MARTQKQDIFKKSANLPPWLNRALERAKTFKRKTPMLETITGKDRDREIKKESSE